MDHEGETTKSGYLTFDLDGIFKINWRTLDQELDSNKASISGTNKITKAILEMPQNACPANFRVKVLLAFQSVCQVSSQLNSK